MEDGDVDKKWREADYKHLSAPRSVDFRRFGALRAYDMQTEPHTLSRREYALRISERIRDFDDDVPDTTTTLETRKEMEESNSKTEKNKRKKEKKKMKMKSFDLDGEVMKEELERRIKFAYWLSEVNKSKKRMNGKKKENDPDDEAKGQEFMRRIQWTYEISKKHGIAASDAASKTLNQAEKAATALYSSS